ncbi:2TM domain-containing protein, partial [Chloroflexota bacterium]
TYVIVNAVLVVIWALSGQGYPWFLWPLSIWGIFVLGHYLRIFVFEKGSDRLAIEKEVEKMKKGQP